MEAHVAATDPLVIDGLQYKLKPNGQYVTSRQSVSFHPSGSNVYKPVGGTKVLRIVVADGSGGWLDPESVKLQFDVVNEETDAAKRLRPISPWFLFKENAYYCWWFAGRRHFGIFTNTRNVPHDETSGYS